MVLHVAASGCVLEVTCLSKLGNHLHDIIKNVCVYVYIYIHTNFRSSRNLKSKIGDFEPTCVLVNL